jgi:hypothetical protein
MAVSKQTSVDHPFTKYKTTDLGSTGEEDIMMLEKKADNRSSGNECLKHFPTEKYNRNLLHIPETVTNEFHTLLDHLDHVFKSVIVTTIER